MFLITVDEKWKISAAVFWRNTHKGAETHINTYQLTIFFLRISFSKVHFKAKLSSLTLYSCGRGGHE